MRSCPKQSTLRLLVNRYYNMVVTQIGEEINYDSDQSHSLNLFYILLLTSSPPKGVLGMPLLSRQVDSEVRQ